MAGDLGPNLARGEAPLVIGGRTLRVRPSFEALVAAEAETGPLLALVERAADGKLALAEIEALLWHCLAARPADMQRAQVGEALMANGVGAVLPALRAILQQIVAGSA